MYGSFRPQDELERETNGEIVTIAVSYILMFIYITFSLGRITKWSRFLVRRTFG